MTRELLLALGGWVRVRITGRGGEAVLRRVTEAGHRVWRVERDSAHTISASLPLAALPALRAAVRGAHVKVALGERGGLRLATRRARGRPGLWSGFMIATAGVLWLSGHIWIVDAPHFHPYPEARAGLLEAAGRAGLFPGASAAGIRPAAVGAAMERLLPRYFWIRVSLHGVLAEIEAVPVEAKAVPAVAPRLVATASGRVREVEVYIGEPLVRVGDQVRKGETLIQGGESTAEAPGSEVKTPASGSVLADVTHRVAVSEPYGATLVKPGPRRAVRTRLIVEGEVALPAGVAGAPAWPHRVEVTERPVVYRGIEMPLVWQRVVYNEIREIPRRLSVAEAIDLASRKAEREMARTLPPGGRWLSRARTVKRTRTGVTVTLVWHAEEEIAGAPPVGRE